MGPSIGIMIIGLEPGEFFSGWLLWEMDENGPFMDECSESPTKFVKCFGFISHYI
jgi:hypothetical protein